MVEEPGNPRLAHRHLFFRQANLKLRKRTIRLFRYKFLNPICMWIKRESLVPAELVWADTARFALATARRNKLNNFRMMHWLGRQDSNLGMAESKSKWFV